MSQLRASLIVPARNEELSIGTFLNRVDESISLPIEVIIVVDSDSDTTFSGLPITPFKNLVIRPVTSSYGNGPANAIRFGFDAVRTGVAIVTMADGSDDPKNIDELIRLVERGCSIAAASRYMAGGQQIGGPRFKKFLSKNASRLLHFVAGVSIHDATNSFKAYSVPFVSEVKIESLKGFECGIELTAKAHRRRLLIAEVPTIWIDRMVGESNFQLRKWLPQYLKWFFYAFGKTIN